jgi:RNA polymerase sigma-70 factor (ECF subfamily)
MKHVTDKHFEKIIRDNHGLILKVCRMFCPDLTGQQDLYQDICINIWKGLPGFNERSALSTWLYRVALNTALSNYKKKSRDPLHYAGEVEDLPLEIAEDASMKVQALYKGIRELKDTEKAIILLYLEEKSYEEIAGIIGISQKNVSVKLVRIKKKLEDIINSYLTKRGTKQ